MRSRKWYEICTMWIVFCYGVVYAWLAHQYPDSRHTIQYYTNRHKIVIWLALCVWEFMMAGNGLLAVDVYWIGLLDVCCLLLATRCLPASFGDTGVCTRSTTSTFIIVFDAKEQLLHTQTLILCEMKLFQWRTMWVSFYDYTMAASMNGLSSMILVLDNELLISRWIYVENSYREKCRTE